MAADFFTAIHKSLRRQLFRAVEAAGAADVADAQSLGALTATVTRAIAALRAHARHEDTWVQPLIARVAPAVHAILEREHAEQEPLLDAIEAATANALIERSAAAAGALYAALHRFTAFYLVHIVREEETMPILRARISAEELEATHAGLVASLRPDERLAGIADMLPALNGDERALLLERMSALPPAAREAVWRVAAEVLPAADLERLRARVGASIIAA